MKRTFTTALLLTLFFTAYAQQAIPLENPSLEGTPRNGTVPGGWFSCGPENESPPDLHPCGEFGVDQLPFEGRSYVGMVVRDNNTWESFGQRLAQPMAKGQCYQLSLHLCRSGKYVSLSRKANQLANYAVPAILRVWGGTQDCEKAQLLAKTEPIEHLDWAYYELYLQPEADFEFLLLEAYYEPHLSLEPYNGNVLIDQMSGLSPVDCEAAAAAGKVVAQPVQEQRGSNSSYPVLEVELPSEDGLLAFIAEQGRQAKFTASGDDFYQRYFIDGSSPNQEVIFGNEHLYWIAKALIAHPGYMALFSVGGEGDATIRGRLGSIRAVFQAAGLAESQYGLKPQSRSDRKREWLWGVDEHEYLIRVVKQ